MRPRQIVVGALTAAAAAILVGGVVASGFDWTRDAEELDAALADARPVRVADIAAGNGRPARGVFAQVTATGQLCISEAPLDAPLAGGGGCNPADSPLGGRVLSATLSYDGGPAIEAVRDARVFGLADARVDAVRIVMTDGSTRGVPLRRTAVSNARLRVFGYRIRTSDLEKGVAPVAIVALDANGVVLGRQPTGIG